MADRSIIGVAILMPGFAHPFVHEPPGRHHTIIHALSDSGFTPDQIAGGIQGFVTNEHKFVNRRQACTIARKAGQIMKKTGPAFELYSEDLW